MFLLLTQLQDLAELFVINVVTARVAAVPAFALNGEDVISGANALVIANFITKAILFRFINNIVLVITIGIVVANLLIPINLYIAKFVAADERDTAGANSFLGLLVRLPPSLSLLLISVDTITVCVVSLSTINILLLAAVSWSKCCRRDFC